MSCCVQAGDFAAAMTDSRMAAEETLLASRLVEPGIRQSDLSVPRVHCGACILAVETALAALPGVVAARLNLSTRRVSVRWQAEAAPPPFIDTLARAGYAAHLDDGSAAKADPELAELIRALAVAGFAASNIMLLSVSIWSGAEAPTRDTFHWLSALIALPTLLYSGRIFFRSAWAALRHGRTNMDVPISIGVSLAFGLSLYETIHGGHEAYFDASVTLLFFLLIGRTLDHMMRERARLAVSGLARLAARGALVLEADGTRRYRPIAEIEPGMQLLLAAGERVPVDAIILDGRSVVDGALVTGEAESQPAAAGDTLRAGMLNLTAPLTMRATAAARDSFLAEMIRLMEAAENGRSQYRRIADRAARLYAPVVHLAALLTFIGWMAATGGDLHRSMIFAIAVLIITCPCALGLAVPMVQMVASRRLFEKGIMLKDGGALERLAEIDIVVFDKTGTLTYGTPRLLEPTAIAPDDLATAATLAAYSRHPYSQAILAWAGTKRRAGTVTDIHEVPGAGIAARIDGVDYRLGRAGWAIGDAGGDGDSAASVVLARSGRQIAAFQFGETLRAEAETAVAALRAEGIAMEMLSGDRDSAAAPVAATLGIAHMSRVTPAGKAKRIAELGAGGRKVLMVGDGLNDGPALVSAHASMAPANAADVGRSAADFVFLKEPLSAVPEAFALARAAGRLVQQNLALAILYNVVAVPIAVLGYVTPLVAAIAMSLSSVIVVGNALRLGTRKRFVGLWNSIGRRA